MRDFPSGFVFGFLDLVGVRRLITAVLRAASDYTVNGGHSRNNRKRPHNTPEQRQSAYRELFRDQWGPGRANQFRSATNGNERFLKEIASALDRRVTRGKAGRPVHHQRRQSGNLFEGDE